MNCSDCGETLNAGPKTHRLVYVNEHGNPRCDDCFKRWTRRRTIQLLEDVQSSAPLWVKAIASVVPVCDWELLDIELLNRLAARVVNAPCPGCPSLVALQRTQIAEHTDMPTGDVVFTDTELWLGICPDCDTVSFKADSENSPPVRPRSTK